MDRLIRIAIPVIVLALGFGVWKWIGHPLDPPAPRFHPPRTLETEVLELQRTSYPITLKSQGNIRAHHTTTLTPLVGGRIVKIHPQFEDGAFFKKDEPLIELDPADFKAALAETEAALARAQAALAQEQARAKQAKLNWDEIGYDTPPSDLVLRIPQLKEARANVDAAAARLDQATRNLNRATVRAPFDGRVSKRTVGLGQSVNPSTPVGEVFTTDFAEVRLPLTPRQIAVLALPAIPGASPVPVTLTAARPDAAAPEEAGTSTAKWQARIVRAEGTLDESSRELFAIARIEDPFGLQSDHPPLRIGQPVRAAIQGKTLENVFVIPRHALRGINRIQLVETAPDAKTTLRRHTIVPVWSDEQFIVVRDGLEPGQFISISRLPYALDGAPVRIIQAPSNAANPPEAEHNNG
jgi:RND family efflux transporter MFP subunit